MIAIEIRSKRIEAGIPGYVLCLKARVVRTRLSDIESGYVTPAPEELSRIAVALEDLIRAKRKVATVAAKEGWPLPL
jgi:hypothetical protein